MSSWKPVPGANLEGHTTRFRVWAPEAAVVDVVIEKPLPCGRGSEMEAVSFRLERRR